MYKIKLPFEDRNIKPGHAMMVDEPDNSREHYVQNIEYEVKRDQINTILTLVPFTEYDSKQRSELIKEE